MAAKANGKGQATLRELLGRQDERMRAMQSAFEQYCKTQEANCERHEVEIARLSSDVRIVTAFKDRAQGALLLWPTVTAIATGLIVGLTIFAAGRVWPLPH